MTNKTTNSKTEHMNRILEILHEEITRSNMLHNEFLQHQALSLQILSDDTKKSYPSENTTISEKVLINKRQMEEFGTGSIVKCFGPEFEILDQRKSPRIPNGDLLMIDRVLAISGKRGKLEVPASIITEFDFSENSWFIDENLYSGIPFGILMEIALQPCGILSAYLGTSLILPKDVNLFRNLDGEISFKACSPIFGGTITNHASLLSSVSGGGMLIQKYDFNLMINGSLLLSGNSSFGYFTEAVMEKQTGIDDSNNDFSKHVGYRDLDINRNTPSNDSRSIHHLDLIDRVSFKKGGGKYGLGAILGEKIVSNREWFYSNHFFQDPVMPGSLGVEAIILGLWTYARNTYDKKYFSKPIIEFSQSDSFLWKYRGQVTPASRKLNFKIHIKKDKVSDSSISFLADADFWVDGIKIYTVQNISMAIGKGKQ